MPIYPYKCETCQIDYDIMKPVSRFNSPEVCPVCSLELDRLVSLPAKPVFKGSGFYETDYKPKKESEPSDK